ncbi:hypothetical protein QL093DRAFT_2569521 [Fusarium oxysporum]|nr:hypothetical protein QL093DRAFT_2569521 [Fusarium oxysporum]
MFLYLLLDKIEGLIIFLSLFSSFSYKHLLTLGFNLNNFKHSALTFIVLFAIGRPSNNNNTEFFTEEFIEQVIIKEGNNSYKINPIITNRKGKQIVKKAYKIYYSKNKFLYNINIKPEDNTKDNLYYPCNSIGNKEGNINPNYI